MEMRLKSHGTNTGSIQTGTSKSPYKQNSTACGSRDKAEVLKRQVWEGNRDVSAGDGSPLRRRLN